LGAAQSAVAYRKTALAKKKPLAYFSAPMSDPMHKTALQVSALSVLPAGFHSLDGARKVDAILGLDDPQAFIQSLAADDLYLLVVDIGATDCSDLLALSTPAQRNAFIDLDCWRGDELDTESFDEWLDLFSDVSHDVAIGSIGALDHEFVVAYLLMHVLIIFDRLDVDDIHQYEAYHAIQYTPDMEYALVIKPSVAEEAQQRVKRLVKLIYRRDHELARSLIITARVGLRTENEEIAYRFRKGRLADLGFPGPDEAHVLYAAIRLDALKTQLADQIKPAINVEGERLSLALVRGQDKDSFLTHCLADMQDKDRFVRDFAMCFNRAVVGTPEGIMLRDLKRLKRIGRRVHCTISVGLEHLADGDVARGVSILESAWCLQLFQAGHSLAVELARRARQLHARSEGLFDATTERVVAALLQTPQPRFVDAKGLFAPFASLADLAATDAILQSAESMVDLFESAFGFSLERMRAHEFHGLTEDDRLFINFEILANTLLAHMAADGAPSFEPLTTAQLAKARNQLTELDKLATGLASNLTHPQAAEVLAGAAAALTAGLAHEDLDPAYLSGVVLLSSE